MTDSSGFRLYYTNILRTYDTGALTLGVPPQRGLVIPPKFDDLVTRFHCSSQCLSGVSYDCFPASVLMSNWCLNNVWPDVWTTFKSGNKMQAFKMLIQTQTFFTLHKHQSNVHWRLSYIVLMFANVCEHWTNTWKTFVFWLASHLVGTYNCSGVATGGGAAVA